MSSEQTSLLSCAPPQVSEMYSFVVSVLESEVGGIVTKKHKDWTKLCQMKAQYFMAVAYVSGGCSLCEWRL